MRFERIISVKMEACYNKFGTGLIIQNMELQAGILFLA